MATNNCPVCGGRGRLLAFGLNGLAASVRCPECAGMAIVPASADDDVPPATPGQVPAGRRDRTHAEGAADE